MNKDVIAVQDISRGHKIVAENSAVPAGYQLSEVGIIPEDWEVTHLRNCLVSKPSYGINAAAAPYSDRLPTYIRITDISESGRFKPFPAVSVQAELAKHYYLSVNDIVFARTGASVGKSYLYRSDDGPLVYAGFLIRITPDQWLINSGFLAAYVTTGRYWQWVRLMSMRSGQPGINGAEYSQLPVPLPSLDEQNAITTALSDVDAMLEELDNLIAKKRDIKQAAMQQLLTGETRLPGLDGDWEVKQLGEVLQVRHGRNQKEVEVKDGEYPIYASGGEIGRSDTYLYARPSVLIGRKGTIDAPRYCDQPFWTVDTLFYTELFDLNSPKFIYYKFCMIPWRNYNEASGVPSLSAKTIESINIVLPSPEEQEAIAAVISDMDTEIQALEKRRSKTAKLKQGMMQELLTGRTRLV